MDKSLIDKKTINSVRDKQLLCEIRILLFSSDGVLVWAWEDDFNRLSFFLTLEQTARDKTQILTLFLGGLDIPETFLLKH